MRIFTVAGVLGGLADGALGEVLQGLTRLLSDRNKTRLHIVTLPERLPLHEAGELIARTQAQGRVGLGTLWVNRTQERPLAPEDDLSLAKLQQRLSEPSEALEALLEALRAHDEAQALIASLPMPVMHLPALSAMTQASLLALGAHAYAGIAR